jgi:isopenicillin N synthase-like dioxygenase
MTTDLPPVAPRDGSILDVDLLRFERGTDAQRRAVVDGVMRSLGTGFVYARHDIPAETVDAAYDGLRRFFHQPADVKARYVVPGSHGQTGYTGLLVETAAGARRPDWKEMLNWGLELPAAHPLRRAYPHRYERRELPEAEVPGIGAVLARLWDALFDLQRRFLRIVAVGIGCDERFFDTMLDGGPTLCRAIRYPAMDAAPDRAHVWAGAHGDINLVTALPRATARGLQVDVGGRWVDATAPEGHAILNGGMMLERLTNGRIAAGVHRVVADPDQRGERLSVVQFCHPTPRTVLGPVPSCVGPDRPLRYSTVEAGAWLDQVLYDIGLVQRG